MDALHEPIIIHATRSALSQSDYSTAIFVTQNISTGTVSDLVGGFVHVMISYDHVCPYHNALLLA